VPSWQAVGWTLLSVT